MFLYLVILFCSFGVTKGRHFDGGSITWAPLDPYDNSSSVGLTITQSYAWSYPTITCATNVPSSTSGRSTQYTNLTCVVDCSTDGGYSTQPFNTLTDCTSVSASLGMMSSARSHNLTLTAGAHFYLANVGSAWVALNYPSQSGLEWSIVTLIDLRMRPDGFINTPPVASVVSPQYAFVNQTMQFNIPVSDVNAGDDVRCRWSTYTAGYRRRRRSNDEQKTNHEYGVDMYKPISEDNEIRHTRKKRTCNSGCGYHVDCTDLSCQGTTCVSPKCQITCCDYVDTTTTTAITSTTTTTTTTSTTTTKTTTTTTTTSTTTTTTTTSTTTTKTTTTTTTTSTTTTKTTTTTTVTTTTTTTTMTTSSTTEVEISTIDTPGTLKSTSSYPHRQAIDECGGICYPGSLPNGTTLSSCTITFTGLKAGTWYAVAVQVEDFINSTSTTPMSSVPVQFLIYVEPQPACSKAPLILPVNGCLEVQVGVVKTFDVYAMNLCNKTVANLSAIMVSSAITGMSAGNLTSISTNSSISYVTFTWTPQLNQVGSQQLCIIAFTSEKLQSNQSCIIFTVKTTPDLCVPTTTTSTTTTSQTTTTTTTVTTTTTSETTTTTTSTTTSETTTTTSETTSTATTSTSTTTTTTSTATSSTSTSTTSTYTTTITTSTTTSSTSTSTTSTSTIATTTSTTTSSTSTSTTSSTSTSSTSSTSTSSTSTSTTSTSTSTTTTSVTTTTSTTTSTTTATTATTTSVTTATTTTTKTPKKSTNWLLILGLSLLALLLALCCSCCCLYWLLWGPAARRRRQRKSEDDVGHETFLLRNTAGIAQKRQAASRIYQPSALSKHQPGGNVVHNNDYITRNSPSDLHIRLSESGTVMTDVEERRVSSTISVKKIRRSSIAKMNNIEKLNSNEDAHIKPANHLDTNGNSSGNRHPIVTVHRVSKAPNMDETNATRQKTSSVTPSKVVQINVTKIPRNKTNQNQQHRSSSVGNGRIIQLDKPSIEMRPMTNHSRKSTVTTGGKANTSNRVTVTKLPRQFTASQSHRS